MPSQTGFLISVLFAHFTVHVRSTRDSAVNTSGEQPTEMDITVFGSQSQSRVTAPDVYQRSQLSWLVGVSQLAVNDSADRAVDGHASADSAATAMPIAKRLAVPRRTRFMKPFRPADAPSRRARSRPPEPGQARPLRHVARRRSSRRRRTRSLRKRTNGRRGSSDQEPTPHAERACLLVGRPGGGPVAVGRHGP